MSTPADQWMNIGEKPEVGQVWIGDEHDHMHMSASLHAWTETTDQFAGK